jgi:hypothetical protein
MRRYWLCYTSHTGGCILLDKTVNIHLAYAKHLGRRSAGIALPLVAFSSHAPVDFFIHNGEERWRTLFGSTTDTQGARLERVRVPQWHEAIHV